MDLLYLSTFGIKCGLAEFGRNLLGHLKVQGVRPTIWANIPSGKNQQDHLVLPDDGWDVLRCWSVTGWSGQMLGPQHRLGLPRILHINYESFLFPIEWLAPLCRAHKAAGGVVVVTFHSAGVSPGFPRETVDFAFCHTKEVHDSVPGRNKLLYPMPAPYQPPRVGTFGLGRAHVPWIAQACQELGWEFVNLIHEHGEWVPQDELLRQLRTCDVIALPYPPVGTSVSSSAAAFALSTYRPLVVSDTRWFSTLPPEVLRHAWTYEAFKAALELALPAHPYIKARSWQDAAWQHKNIYRQLLEEKP